MAQVALLAGQYRMSLRQIQRYLRENFSLKISLGAISEMQGRMTPWMWPVAQAVRDFVRRQPVVHADETSHYRQTEYRWMWTLVTGEAAYFQTHYSRGKGAARHLLGEEFDFYLVSDRLGSYRCVQEDRRQLCLAHVLRNFQTMAESEGGTGALGQKIQRLLRLLVHAAHQRDKGQLSTVASRRLARRLQRLLQYYLEQGQLVARKRIRGQCAALQREINSVFTLLNAPIPIPATNNEAERALRSYVIWRKTSFATQSARGDQFRAHALTIIETCKRQGLRAMDVMEQLCLEGLRGWDITASALREAALLVEPSPSGVISPKKLVCPVT